VLVLTGRSELGGDKQAELSALERLGARVEYRRVDVADAAAVLGLVAEVCARHGGLHGVVHSAGVLRDSFLVNKSAEDVRAVLSPKVAGVVARDAATRDAALEFMILFGSGSGALGNVGQADYAAGNAFMAGVCGVPERAGGWGLRRVGRCRSTGCGATAGCRSTQRSRVRCGRRDRSAGEPGGRAGAVRSVGERAHRTCW
jgi:polyketide synthase PksN